MTSLSSRAVGHGLDPLSHSPTELLVTIFSLLSRFSDVFALAVTCHRLRHVWMTSTNVIYRQVAPRCIPCEQHARMFLADQGGPAKESPMLSAEDVRRLVRNSWVVEKAISEFEKTIVCKVRSMLYPKPRISNIILISQQPDHGMRRSPMAHNDIRRT